MSEQEDSDRVLGFLREPDYWSVSELFCPTKGPRFINRGEENNDQERKGIGNWKKRKKRGLSNDGDDHLYTRHKL